MWGKASAVALAVSSLVACNDPAPASPALLASDVLRTSRAELSAIAVEPTSSGPVVVAKPSPDEPITK